MKKSGGESRQPTSTQRAPDQYFETYLAALRNGSLFAPGLTIKQIKEWESDALRKPSIERAKAEWKERSDRITSSVLATLRLIKEGKYKVPHPGKPLPKDDDPNTIIFNSKILPNLENDWRYTEATLVAMNLPGWADQIARIARARDNPKHKARVERFFIELGKALQRKRRLWDAIDELIATNYYGTERYEAPLCEMTEEQASKKLNLSVAAYDKRLLRLGIRKDRVGRPAKHAKNF